MHSSAPHRLSVRVRSDARTGARVYVRKNHFDIGAPVSFDEQYPAVTALDYLLGAIAGDLVSGLQGLARRERVVLDHVEAVVQAELSNPLVCLGAVGAEGDPGLEAISVKLFVDTLEDEQRVRDLWGEVLRRSAIWHTFRASVPFDIELELTS
jgi:hypothetical protein